MPKPFSVFLGFSCLQSQLVQGPQGAFLSCCRLLLGPACLGGIGPGSAYRHGRPRPAYSGLLSSWLPAPPPPASINTILRGFGHSLFYLMLPLHPGGLGIPCHTCPLPCFPLSPEPRLLGWRISYSNPWMGFRARRSWSWLSMGTWVDCFGLQVSVYCRHSGCLLSCITCVRHSVRTVAEFCVEGRRINLGESSRGTAWLPLEYGGGWGVGTHPLRYPLYLLMSQTGRQGPTARNSSTSEFIFPTFFFGGQFVLEYGSLEVNQSGCLPLPILSSDGSLTPSRKMGGLSRVVPSARQRNGLSWNPAGMKSY